MEALRTSIEANKSNVQLANKSIENFKNSKADNRIALFTTLGVSLLTLTILILQTFSISKTQITKPIQLNPSQVEQLLKTQAFNNEKLILQLDSLKKELQTITTKLDSTNIKK